MTAPAGRILGTEELRGGKPQRDAFRSLPRAPIHVLLDGVQRSYNLGAIFRLCDAMLVERLIVCGLSLEMHKRRLVQAAQGAQNWVPWENPPSAVEAVLAMKQSGFDIVVGEITSTSVAPRQFVARFPLCLVLGNERTGVSPEIVALADAAVAVPMRGMANSLNVATAAAILLYEITSQAPTRSVMA